MQFTTRTTGSELFVNPLMSIYFTVRLEPLTRRNLYLDRLEGTTDTGQVSLRIEEFRAEISPRIPRAFPH
ncbi:hypothetical protein [Winogradskya humida]|uniref:Uncharacterized protein n=1 Tax=Winogradskya humida TaxID=113566 RepID=A0ABQ3ZSY8_9ACTN|nr:hypothetical protein [Actinoplanes humidus]GIE21709.1 hypothetical protein Ahu01nite_048110 [Actinoplanes humidus]